ETLFQPKELLTLIERERITCAEFVPASVRAIIENTSLVERQRHLASLSLMICGSEKWSIGEYENIRKSLRAGARLVSSYGLTELTIDSTYFECNTLTWNNETATVPIGIPFPGVEIYVLDAHFMHVPRGVTGELFVGGPSVARGYLHNPTLTDERFLVNPLKKTLSNNRLYKTGDLVRYLSDGRTLQFVGRIDEQIKVRGYRIELTEIECILSRVPEVRQTITMAQKDNAGQISLVAYVLLRTEFDSEKKQEIRRTLRDHAMKHLPGYMVPNAYVILEFFPFLPNGKVNRKALPMPNDVDRLLDRASDENQIQAETPVEKDLLSIWQRVLHRTAICLNDNFFQLGGDSILAIQLISSIRRMYRIPMTTSQLFRSPTIRKLAEELQTLLPKDSSVSYASQNCRKENAATNENSVIPLTPIQQWFFEQNFENFNNWSQCALMTFPVEIKSSQAKESLFELVRKHPGLFSKYYKDETSNRWLHLPCFDSSTVDLETSLELLDLISLPANERDFIIANKIEQADSSLDITVGKLWHALLVSIGDDVGLTLYIVIHHLVVDGVSWRIFTEDLEDILNSHCFGRNEISPSTSDSFSEWAAALVNEAQSTTITDEFKFWSQINSKSKNAAQIPRDFDHGTNTMQQSSVVHTTLDQKVTDLLLPMLSSYSVTMYDALLTALLFSLRLWCHHDQFYLILEGHGREAIDADVDISRTIGWFTTEFPIFFDFTCTHQQLSIHHLRSVHDQLQAVPNRGFGFGLLKYLNEDANIHDVLAALPEPDILFNYLGVWKTKSDRQLIETKGCSALDKIGPMNHRQRLIDFESYIIDDQLHAYVTYSQNHFESKTIEQLVKNFLTAIQEISNFQLSSSTSEPISCNSVISYPLSPMQSGMLYRCLQYPHSDEYLVQGVFKLSGVVDTQRVLNAWQILIDSYDILRSSFDWDTTAGLYQRVEPVGIRIPFDFLDWSVERTKLNDFLIADRGRLFDLHTAPLCRITLIKLSSDDYLLVFTHHHILLDGWSTPLVLEQFLKAYDRRHQFICRGSQYGDFIQHIETQKHEYFNNIKTFWQTYLQDLKEPCYLTSAFQHLITNTEKTSSEQNHDEIVVHLPSQLLESIDAFCRRCPITMSNLLLGCWAIILSRYLQRIDIAFGITISGRTVPVASIEHSIGIFINTIPLYISTAYNQSIDMLISIQEQLCRLQEMGTAVSLGEIQSWGKLGNGQPLFDTLFIIENYPDISKRHTYSLKCDQHALGEIEKTEYPLTVCITFDDKTTRLALNYKTKYFPSSTSIVKRLAEHYLNVLENIVTEPNCSPQHVRLLSNEELNEQLVMWNNQTVENPWYKRKPNSTVHGLIEDVAKCYSRRIAIVHNQRSISYGELNKVADRLAQFFILKGYIQKPDDLVVISCDRSINFFILILAILKAGGAYVPVDIATPLERLLFIVNDTKTHLVLIDSEQRMSECQTRLSTQVAVCQIDAILLESNDDADTTFEYILSFGYEPATSRSLAYVIYTSGSTGLPKGVLIEHQNILWYRDSLQHRYSLTDGMLYDFSSSIAFDLSVTSTLIPMLTAGTVIICNDDIKRDIFKFHDHLVQNRIQLIKCTPSFFIQMANALCNDDQIQLPYLTTFVIGGEILPVDSVRQWLKKFSHHKIFNEYGPTETTVGVSEFLADANSITSVAIHEKGLPVGKPFPYAAFYILDRNNEVLPSGLIGELCIGGFSLARGYLNRVDLTHRSFVEIELASTKTRVYRTGDLVYYLSTMDVQCAGRVDHQVKIRGYRVELGEIEYQIKSYLNLTQIHVLKSTDSTSKLIAFIGGLRENHSQIELDLRNHLNSTLPEYMRPQLYVFIDQFPLTTNDKVDSTFLMNLARDSSYWKTHETNHVYPRNLTEFRLHQIWSSILGTNNFGILENFFDLGGHSLLIISMIIQIKQVFTRTITVTSIVANPTIEKLSKYINQELRETNDDSVLSICSGTDETPLFLIHAIEGISFIYSSLAPYFKEQHTIIALNDPMFTDAENKFNNIESMATFYISLIRKKQPKGPYRLGGWSFGGKVAFEMACQLEKLGEGTEVLILLDSYLTETYREFNICDDEAFEQSLRKYVTNQGVELCSKEAEYLANEIKNNVILSSKYEPRSYFGRVVLIKASVNHNTNDTDFIDPFNGCKNIIQSEIEVFSVHCEHSKMFASENVEQIVTRLKYALSTATADPVLVKFDLSCESRHLLHAAHHQDYFLLQRFIELGADINAQDDHGRTVVHWAAHLNDGKIFDILKRQCANKVDLSKKDIHGQSARDIAEKNNDEQDMTLFRNYFDFSYTHEH
ncbi:unnamed protein product, partial [Adineta ricciae]